MCRFLVYKGREAFLSDLLMRAEQSLIRQSFKAREREEPLNGDGFGVGWYQPHIDPTPCVFTSTSPAWSNRNLHRLADKVRSSCLFAHVRAASPGLFVSEMNCHPFQYERFLWMHNGGIADFGAIKRRLRESLRDEIYDVIQGTTDSEHAFAVFLHHLYPTIEDYTIGDLQDAMTATIAQLNFWTREAGITDPSRYNFAVTDGHSVLASRYVSDDAVAPHSLYVASGDRFETVEDRYHMRPAEHRPNAAIIASEPLTEDRADWTAVPPNHMVAITPELHIRMAPVI